MDAWRLRRTLQVLFYYSLVGLGSTNSFGFFSSSAGGSVCGRMKWELFITRQVSGGDLLAVKGQGSPRKTLEQEKATAGPPSRGGCCKISTSLQCNSWPFFSRCFPSLAYR